MTIVFGMKAKDGALLVADCYATDGRSHKYIPKIVGGIHSPEEDVAMRALSGVYYGKAGHYWIMDTGDLSKRTFSENPQAAFLLTDDLVINRSLDDCNNELDQVEQEYRESLRTEDEDKNQERYQLREKVQEAKLRLEMRAFIESTVKSLGFNISRIVLRFSPRSSPDILLIHDGRVEVPSTYEAVGSGGDIARTLLKRSYSSCKTLDEALPVATETLNKILEDTANFRGYQIVIVQRLENGTNKIKTAKDLEAQRMDLGAIDYLDPWFQRREH